MTVNATSRWDHAAYAANAAFVPAMGAPVLALLNPQLGAGALDLGCGDGVLTEAIVAAGAEVVGVDASPEMVAARARSLDARVADGQALGFHAEFDAAFSNAALHWMLDEAAVARSVHAALKPGGRFVGEMGGDGNVASIWAATRAVMAERGHRARPVDTHWYPTVADFTATYAAAGFVAIEAELIPLPTGVAGWIATFRSGLMDVDGIPADEQAAIGRATAARLEPDLPRDEEGRVLADYVRLRFTIRKP